MTSIHPVFLVIGSAFVANCVVIGTYAYHVNTPIPEPPRPVSLSQSTVAVSLAKIPAGRPATVTLQARDVQGNPLTRGGLKVEFGLKGDGLSKGTFDNVIDQGNGTYSAIFTGATAGNPKIITAAIDGNAVTSALPAVTVTPGTASPKHSIVSIAQAIVMEGDKTRVTLIVKDAHGNALTTGGLNVKFGLRDEVGCAGTLSNFVDHKDGTYSEIFTGTRAGTARTVIAMIDGSEVESVVDITVTPGPSPPSENAVSLTKSIVTITPNVIASGSSATVTLTAKDAAGKPFTEALSVAFDLDRKTGVSDGAFSKTTPKGAGAYTAEFTGTTAGIARKITATINGESVPRDLLPTVTVIPGPPSPAHSIVTIKDASIMDGKATTVALTVKDANGNAPTSGDLKVEFKFKDVGKGKDAGKSDGKFGPAAHQGKGVYTATFEGTHAGSARSISAAIDGNSVISTSSVVVKKASVKPFEGDLLVLVIETVEFRNPDTFGKVAAELDDFHKKQIPKLGRRLVDDKIFVSRKSGSAPWKSDDPPAKGEAFAPNQFGEAFQRAFEDVEGLIGKTKNKESVKAVIVWHSSIDPIAEKPLPKPPAALAFLVWIDGHINNKNLNASFGRRNYFPATKEGGWRFSSQLMSFMESRYPVPGGQK